MHRQNLGEMLIAANLIDEVQMQIALAAQKQNGKRFGSTLVDLNFIDENVLAAFLSKQIDVPCISLLRVDVSRNVLRRIPRPLAIECRAVPIRMDGDRLEVAMVDPSDIDAIDRIEKAAGMTITPLIAPQSSIETVIAKFYPEEVADDETLTAKHTDTRRNAPSDPAFWDVISEMGAGDLDERLERIEESLERIWVLLEKVLRTLEVREGAHRDER